MEYIAHQRKFDGALQNVNEHSIGTSNLSSERATKVDLLDLGELQGFLHDPGKYSPPYQNYLASELGFIDPKAKEYVKNGRGKVDHSTAGGQFLYNNVDRADPIFVYIVQIVALCTMSHHSGLIDCLSPKGENIFLKRIFKDHNKTNIDKIHPKIKEKITNRINEIINRSSFLEDFKKTMRKVCKGESQIIQHFRINLLVRFLFSCLVDADRLDTANFVKPEQAKLRLNNEYPEWSKFIDELDLNLLKFSKKSKINKIRNKISMICKSAGIWNQGIYSLTAPTGGGKTLAILLFALEHARRHNLKRIFIIVPFTTIIDQNAAEVRKNFNNLLKESEIILEHHSNLTPEKETEQSKLMSENWDCPIVLTTMVHFLDTLFKGGTRDVRRMHQLAESVIIFDEIQKLPINTVHLFNNAINFLFDVCHSTTVLCSATQPCLDRVNHKKGTLNIKEIMPNVDSLFNDLNRVNISNLLKPEGWTNKETANLIKNELKYSNSLLFIANTKKSAKNIYKLCKIYKKAPVYHLSTSMCPAHRMNVIKAVISHLEKSEPLILISTQLVEAGLNFDFKTVIRCLAGLDSIAQAAGRCNRSGLLKDQEGRVIIINLRNEYIDKLKEIKKGQEITLRVLEEFKNNPNQFDNNLLSPKTLERYFQYYFFDRKFEMDYPVNLPEQNDTLLNMLSINYKALQNYNRKKDAIPLPLNQSFKSAGEIFRVIDSSEQGIIVPYKDGKNIITYLKESVDITQEYVYLKKAQNYSVNVFSEVLEKGVNEGIIKEFQKSGILYIEEEYYDNDYGIITQSINKK